MRFGVVGAGCAAVLVAAPTGAATGSLPVVFPTPQAETALTGTVAVTPTVSLADAIRERLRAVLVVQTRIEFVPFGTLARSEYKSQLLER